MRSFAHIVLVLVSLSVGNQARAALIFDAAADFSATNNPNGVWSYGKSTTLNSAFQIYAQSGINNLDPPNAQLMDTWNAGTGGNFANPAVLHNGTANPVSFVFVTYPAGSLGFHPGPADEYSVVRFTAPISGSYELSSTFSAADQFTTTDVHVSVNGVSIFDAFVQPASAVFNTSLLLAAGDRVDFAVGVGSNGNFSNDSTRLEARLITNADAIVPEPGSLLLFLVAMTALVSFGVLHSKRVVRCRLTSSPA